MPKLSIEFHGDGIDSYSAKRELHAAAEGLARSMRGNFPSDYSVVALDDNDEQIGERFEVTGNTLFMTTARR